MHWAQCDACVPCRNCPCYAKYAGALLSWRGVRYISDSPINERAHCSAAYGAAAHPASVYRSVSGRPLAGD
ncbi:hypothetical protein BJX70DRAFT_357190 [Aspergillus crustosus]